MTTKQSASDGERLITMRHPESTVAILYVQSVEDDQGYTDAYTFSCRDIESAERFEARFDGVNLPSVSGRHSQSEDTNVAEGGACQSDGEAGTPKSGDIGELDKGFMLALEMISTGDYPVHVRSAVKKAAQALKDQQAENEKLRRIARLVWDNTPARGGTDEENFILHLIYEVMPEVKGSSSGYAVLHDEAQKHAMYVASLSEKVKELTAERDSAWQHFNDRLSAIADANTRADTAEAENARLQAREAELLEGLREKLAEGVELFECDDEANTPGTDAYTWLVTARSLLSTHSSKDSLTPEKGE